MRDDKRVLTLSDFEHRMLIGGLNDYRNYLISEDRPTEDLSQLMLKIIDAPVKHRKADREAR